VPTQPVTAYLGSVEIRKFGQGAAEELLLYPHASIRISKAKVAGAIVTGVSAGPILADRSFGADDPPLEDRPGAPHPCSATRNVPSAQ
jgi:hypothetical protein